MIRKDKWTLLYLDNVSHGQSITLTTKIGFMDIYSLHSAWKTHDEHHHSKRQTALKIICLLVALIIIVLLFKSCTRLNPPKQPPTPMLIRKDNTIIVPEGSPLRAQLDVKPVSTSNAPHVVVLSGIVDSTQDGYLSILPPVTGTISQINTILGNEVKKDQVLAVIQSGGFAQAYTDKLKAQSTLTLAQELLQRAQKVNRAGGNTVKDIEQLQSNFAQAQAELQRAQDTLNSIGGDKNKVLQIQAPIGGKIINQYYGAGSYISDPTIPLFTLSNIKSVWVTLCVPEYLVPVVTKGQNVEVFLDAYPTQSWPGKIAFTSHVLDAETRCNKSRVLLENADEKLKPNMFASVRTQVPQGEQISVPLSAILMNNDTTSVFVETAPWTFEPRIVILGAEDENNVRVNSGLHKGDRIIIDGGILVND
jgi:cobalt-zinc-cadmium efflux system membrane fusion protein